MPLTIELTTPERVVLKEPADSLTVPTQDGEITVLPGHRPLVANLLPGMMTVRSKGAESYLAVSGGFIEVQPAGRVLILADTAERAEELDLEKVEAARELARTLLTEKRNVDDVAAVGAAAALERELARIKVVRKHRSRSASNFG